MAYYRVSTDKQAESGLGLEAQRSAVARFIQSVGAQASLVAEYTEAESGKRHTNRPQLAAAIAESKRKGATLCIAKLDRLARNVHFISGLMEAAADFVACDMPSANKLTLHIMAAMAEHEREMISQRTAAGLEQVNQEIERNGFRISKRSGRKFSKLGNPKWQESIGRATAARKRPPTSTSIKAIIENFLSEGLTLRQMAEQMNQLGLKTPTGGAWYASSVRTMLLRTGLRAPAEGISSVPYIKSESELNPQPLAA